MEWMRGEEIGLLNGNCRKERLEEDKTQNGA
jgi:hypothetical protein